MTKPTDPRTLTQPELERALAGVDRVTMGSTVKYTCGQCGQVGQRRASPGGKRYCAACAKARTLASNARTRREQRAEIKEEMLRQGFACLQCGEQFVPKRVDAKFCSGACKVAAHRAGNEAQHPYRVERAREGVVVKLNDKGLIEIIEPSKVRRAQKRIQQRLDLDHP